MKIKRGIYLVLLIIWMIVIFMFSNQNANHSQATSDKVASDIIDTVTEVTKQDVSKEKKETLIDHTRVLVRKTAHFTLYFILGIFIYITLTSYSVSKPIFYSILFCFLYACGDEIHQLFSDGRTAKVLDVFIDTCGSSIGVLVTLALKRLKNKIFLKKEKSIELINQARL